MSQLPSHADTRLKPHLYTSIENSSLQGSIHFNESRVREGRQHDRAKLALPYVGDILSVNEEADLAKSLLAEDADERI